MTAVKDQGNCGSCWAHTAIAVVEAKYNIENTEIGEPIDHNEDLDLSEQQLVSNCYWGGTCSGGFTSGALREIRNDGIPDEDCFPFVGRTTYCRPCDNWESRAWTIDERVDAMEWGDETNDVKRRIICHGPITTCGGGHCVTVVGWNNSLGGWIIKNSWGTSWSNQAGATHIGGGYGLIPWDHSWFSGLKFMQKFYVRGVRRM
jgi:C1A family cysteine protease